MQLLSLGDTAGRAVDYQVIPSQGNPQLRRTLFDGYLFKYCSVKYQTFHQVSEKTLQQTYSDQESTWKAFKMPPRASVVFWLVGEAFWSLPGIAWPSKLKATGLNPERVTELFTDQSLVVSQSCHLWWFSWGWFWNKIEILTPSTSNL